MPATCEHLGGDLFSKELPFANIERVFKPLIFCTVWSLFPALIGWKRWRAGWAGLAVCHRGQHKLMHKSINARFKVSTKIQKTHTHTRRKCKVQHNIILQGESNTQVSRSSLVPTEHNRFICSVVTHCQAFPLLSLYLNKLPMF